MFLFLLLGCNKEDSDINAMNINNKVDKCFGIAMEWGLNTTCKCTKTLYNYSVCDKYINFKYCTNDWDTIKQDEFFYNEIYKYLNYDCETGEMIKGDE
jgi:hypothetical protein